MYDIDKFDVDVDVEEILAQTIVSMPLLNIQNTTTIC